MSDIREPAWIAELRRACTGRSQRLVGRDLGYSATTINQVLKGKYTSDLEAVRRAVEEKLMRQAVQCPVLGDLPRSACLSHQQSKSRSNPMRIALASACPTCIHRRSPCVP